MRNTILPQDLTPYVKEIGGTFCKFLAMKAQLPRSYMGSCDNPTCDWNSWTEALNNSNTHGPSSSRKERVVLSFAHNGFGNQLWQHSVAFMIAESLKARLFVATIPDSLCPDGVTPPNTFAGMSAMERLLPQEFLYDKLPANSSYRRLCDAESFFVADRPRDWRNSTYTKSFKKSMEDIIADPQPRCVRMLGYFQNLPLCADDARRLWTANLFRNNTVKPGENDISIYLRCLPRHYHFNNREFYENILNRTTFDKVWLFQAPECPTKLNPDPARDGIVATVIRLLTTRYNATRWLSLPGADDTGLLLHDLAGLAQSRKVIIPMSSWGYWSGLLSSATEIHVNAPPMHPLMSTMSNYIYHNEKAKSFFGRFDAKKKDIVYGVVDSVESKDSKKVSAVAPAETAQSARLHRPEASSNASSVSPPASSAHLIARAAAAEVQL